MDNSIIQVAANTIKVSVEEAQMNHKAIPELNAHYYWDPKRGGCAVIINEMGEKLAATSSISFEKHLEAFKAGKRN